MNPVLPEVTPWNEYYWTSGRDGVLRVKRCTACDALLHPPGPACPHCRSTALEIVPVSGLARLIGFSVNTRFGLPGIPRRTRWRTSPSKTTTA